MFYIQRNIFVVVTHFPHSVTLHKPFCPLNNFLLQSLAQSGLLNPSCSTISSLKVISSFLNACNLLSDTTGCSRLILYFSYSRPAVSHFFNSLCSSYQKIIFRNQVWPPSVPSILGVSFLLRLPGDRAR